MRLASVAPSGPDRVRIHTPRGMGWRDALVTNDDIMVWATHFMGSHGVRARSRRVLWLVSSLSGDEMDTFLGGRGGWPRGRGGAWGAWAPSTRMVPVRW